MGENKESENRGDILTYSTKVQRVVLDAIAATRKIAMEGNDDHSFDETKRDFSQP